MIVILCTFKILRALLLPCASYNIEFCQTYKEMNMNQNMNWVFKNFKTKTLFCKQTTVKLLKIWTPEKYTVIILKFDLYGFFIEKIDGMANKSDLGVHCLLRPVCPKI